MSQTQPTIVLISGANTGIGYEIAKKLLTDQSNFHVYIGSRDPSKGQSAILDLKSHIASSNSATSVQLDITSDDSIAACVKAVESVHGRLDVLINNAGIAPKEGDMRTIFQSTYDTNVTSTMMLTDACIPLLQQASVPRIIFVTSGLSSITRVLATAANPASATRYSEYRPYVVSKAAMNMLAMSYCVQLGKSFKVNLVCPGLRKTALNGFLERAGNVADGAIEACRLAAAGPEATTGGMTDWDGSVVPW